MPNKVIIEVGDAFCFLKPVDSSLLGELSRDLLSQLTVQHEYWTKHGPRITFYTFYNMYRACFPQGLLPLVTEVLRTRNWQYELRPICDHTYEDIGRYDIGFLELRDYQKKAVEHALFLGRCVICIGTGGGKTEVGAALVAALRVPVLWMINRSQLVHQTYERIRKYYPDMQISIFSGASKDIGKHLTIATVQSLYPYLHAKSSHFFNYFRAIIIDECHQVTQDLWYRIALACQRAHWRFGLTGTIPEKERLRYMRLVAACGRILDYANINELIEQGHAARPRFVFIDIAGKDCARRYDVEYKIRNYLFAKYGGIPDASTLYRLLYKEMYEAGILYNKYRNSLIINLANLAIDAGQKVLILATRVAHAKYLYKYISRATLLTGKNDAVWRTKVTNSFDSSSTGAAIVATSIFDLGVNIPSVHCLIMAGGGKSEIQTQQRIGRALRVAPGKERVLIFDFLDGFDEKNDYLRKHSLERFKIAEKYSGDVVLANEEQARQLILDA